MFISLAPNHIITTQKKEKRKKKILSRQKTREFSSNRRVSQIPRETTAIPLSAFSPRLPESIRIPANREKNENTREKREKERDFG